MDPTTLHDVWLNLATNSPFLAFVIYNWWQQGKMIEAYRVEMKQDRIEYEEKREKAITDIRDRYIKVIDDLKEEKKGGIEERLGSMEKAIKKLFALMDRLKDEINELKIKEEVRNLKEK
tara:strand:- start:187 stop:543 length:357 start_codon:yes stop_codon:yes gene_type:complete